MNHEWIQAATRALNDALSGEVETAQLVLIRDLLVMDLAERRFSEYDASDLSGKWRALVGDGSSATDLHDLQRLAADRFGPSPELFDLHEAEVSQLIKHYDDVASEVRSNTDGATTDPDTTTGQGSMTASVTKEDESWRPPGPEEQFNDSFYFGLASKEGLGLYTRIGRRPNEGIIEGALGIYLPDGRFAMVWSRENDEDDSDIGAGSLRYVPRLPLQHWDLLADGTARVYDRPEHLLTRSDDFEEAPARMALAFHALSGPIAFMGSDTRAAGGSSELEEYVGRSHYEQQGVATGRIRVGDDFFECRMWGMRDHSWGVRNWQAVPFWRWGCVVFDDRHAFGISNVGRSDGGVDIGGWVRHEGKLAAVVECDWTSKLHDQHRWQEQFTIVVTDQLDRTFEVAGQAEAVAPLRQRRGQQETRINEALTHFRMEGFEGYGISEYLLQAEET